MTATPDPMPAQAIIVDADGLPLAHIDFDRLTVDATLFMYDMAETAGDDDATDRVAVDWTARLHPDYFGYVAATALSLLTRHVLAPTLDVCAAAGTDLRPGLTRAAADARRDLGSGQ